MKLGRKPEFYAELTGESAMHSAVEFAMCFDDLNGHVVWYIDGFCRVHGGYGRGQMNFEGIIVLEFCLEKELCVKT